jgi:hypothetical protein
MEGIVNIRTLLAVGGALCVLACGRAEAQAPDAAPGPRRATPHAAQGPDGYLKDLQDIVAALGQRYHAQVLVEPTITVSEKPVPPRAATMGKALDALVAPIRGAAWRRLHLQRPADQTPLDVRQLAGWVRSLDRMASVGLVVENTANQFGTLLMRNYPMSKAFRADLSRAHYQTLYIVYGAREPRAQPAETASRAAPPPTSMEDMMNDRLGNFFAMDPDTRRGVMQQAIAAMWNLDPAMRSELFTEFWTSMPPDQQREVIDIVRQAGLPDPARP